MVFLFKSDIETTVPVSICAECDGTDEAILTQDIWGSFDKLHEDRIVISVTPLHPVLDASQKGQQGISPQLKSVTCWAKQSTSVSVLEAYPSMR